MPEVPPPDRLELVRELHQLRRPLPLEPALRKHGGDAPTGAELRTFTPGRDDEALLVVNNRAFAWHPEQGGWSPADLARPMAEQWFDPEGLLVLDRGGHMVGFCWTKVHPAAGEDPALGEIFVIGVDPDAAGSGFGKFLVVAGLEYLTRAGLSTAMLYVESTNTAARALYDKLGFELHEMQRWYRPRPG